MSIVSVRIDSFKYDIDGGVRKVQDIKTDLEVPQHLCMSQSMPFGLVELADDEHIELKDGMRFVSHVRPGVNS